MGSALVALVVLAGNGTPSFVPSDPEPTPPALQFQLTPDAGRKPPTDDVRVQRFLAAMAGSLVGFGGVQALMPLMNSGACRVGGWCPSTPQLIVSSLSPLAAAFGAWAGFRMLGGDVGVFTPLLGILPAGILAFVTAAMIGTSADLNALLPASVATGAILAGGMAFALDTRSRQLDAVGSTPRADASGVRLALTSLISASGSVVAIGTTMLLLTWCSGRCPEVAGAVGSLLLGAGMVSTWGVHKSLRGRGSPWIAVGGLASGLLMAGMVSWLLPAAFSPAQSVVGIDAVVMGVSLGVFAVPLALEWSHSETIAATHPTLAFGAAPSPSGGTVTAALRF